VRRDGHEQLVICGEPKTAAYARNSQGHCSATLRGEAGAEWTGWKSVAVTDFWEPVNRFSLKCTDSRTFLREFAQFKNSSFSLSFVCYSFSLVLQEKQAKGIILLLLCHPNCEK